MPQVLAGRIQSARLLRRLIVVAAGQDSDLFFLNLVDKPVLLVDALRPAAGEIVLEWLRLTDASEGVFLGFLNHPHDAQRLLAIVLDPPGQVVEGRRVKFQAARGRRQGRYPQFAALPAAAAASCCRCATSMPSLAPMRFRARARLAR